MNKRIEIKDIDYSYLGFCIQNFNTCKNAKEREKALEQVKLAIEWSEDVNEPCWVRNGLTFYNPLEYVLMLYKYKIKGDWIFDIAQKLISKGAKIKDVKSYLQDVYDMVVVQYKV